MNKTLLIIGLTPITYFTSIVLCVMLFGYKKDNASNTSHLILIFSFILALSILFTKTIVLPG